MKERRRKRKKKRGREEGKMDKGWFSLKSLSNDIIQSTDPVHYILVTTHIQIYMYYMYMYNVCVRVHVQYVHMSTIT